MVDLPFKYAAAETDADKMNLENDAADFFTGRHVGSQDENVQEHLAFKKIIRKLTIALSRHVEKGTITFEQNNQKGPNHDLEEDSLPETKSPPEGDMREMFESRGAPGGKGASMAATTMSQKPKGKLKEIMTKKGSKSRI